MDYRYYHACNEAESVLCVKLQLNIERKGQRVKILCPFSILGIDL